VESAKAGVQVVKASASSSQRSQGIASQKRRRTYPFRNKCALAYDINDRSIVFAIGALAISRNGPYMKWSHHFMVFVREDMAMPDVASGLVEVHLDARDLAR
jgi:hypothetical protein